MYLTVTKVYAMVPFETLSKPRGEEYKSLRKLRRRRLIVSKEEA